MRRWNELTIRAKQLEKQPPGLTGEAKEVGKHSLPEGCMIAAMYTAAAAACIERAGASLNVLWGC
jgi:hypothetical protein